MAFVIPTLIVFGRSLRYPFVYDDQWLIVQNPAIRTLNPISRFFLDNQTSANPASGMNQIMYRPLPTLSFALDFKTWGLRPMAYRLENILLHGINGALLYALLTTSAGLSPAASVMGTAVFLFHPGQVESVVWITERSNLLCLMGVLLSLLCLSGRLTARRVLGGFAFFLFALLSKETAAVFPALLLIWNGNAAREENRDGNRWPFFIDGTAIAMTLGYIALRHHVTGLFAQRSFRGGGFFSNWLTGAVSWLEYLKLIVWPFHLTVSHHQFINSPRENPWPWIGALFEIGTLIIVALLLARTKKHPSLRGIAGCALAWIFLTLMPVLGFVPTDTFVGEHFLYLPLIGVGCLVAVAWQALGQADVARLGRMFIGVAIAGLIALTIRRTGDWKSETALWQSAIRLEPENAFAHACLAEADASNREFDKAELEYMAALTKNPSVDLAFAALNNLANIENRKNNPECALRWSDKASKIHPDSPVVLFNRRVSLTLLKQEH
jgi:hypothetical protein